MEREKESGSTEAIVLGGGCFWCMEAVFEQVEGVVGVESGYAGGTVPQPTYREVCAGGTGHAEVVKVTYDPERVSLRDLLLIFFTIHDPTSLDRQGGDVGDQYRSAVLYTDPAQRETVSRVEDELAALGLFNRLIVTEVKPLEEFYPAEAEHRGYYRTHPDQGYCRLVIDPKVAAFRRRFQDLLKPSSNAV